jgi:NAD-dependent DNA ligase
MASLNKIKPGTGAVETFISSSKKKEWVLSDKLDGISVLWDTHKRKLYLRGDGLMGVDVSAFAPYLSGLTPRGFQESWMIRGELVLPIKVPIEGTLSRSWVNGQLHQKKPIPEHLGKIRFVAYELVSPATFDRQTQFQKLEEAGFEVPIHTLTWSLTDEELSEYLKDRRAHSEYPIDGIVIGENSIPFKDSSDGVTNPKDMRAFKMPLEDQKAKTQVVDIVWSASYQGYWIPRIQIQPVLIGGSRIEFLTGHNARFILKNKIGKGAVIVVRKSGDVIPTLESVVTPANPSLPEGTWDGPEDSASHLKVKAGTVSTELLQKKLEHFAKVLDIPHLGPGLIAKLVAGGIRTPNDLLTISESNLQTCVGEGMAKKIYPVLQQKLANCTELELMVASSCMTRGVGDSKLRALFAVQADPRKWKTISSCEGWSKEALTSFLDSMSTYEMWRQTELKAIPYPRMSTWNAPFAPGITLEKPQGTICLTGFRDAEFQKEMEGKGYVFVNSVTKKTTVLIVKSKDDVSEKMKKAEEFGIPILTREEAKAEYLRN